MATSPRRLPRPYRHALARVPSDATAGQTVADLSNTDEVVVFVVGMRIHRWRKVRSWWPAFTGMPKMLAELRAEPAEGLLAAQSAFAGRTFFVVQYWRSAEDLGRYARDPQRLHAPAWSAFNKAAAGSGHVGLFHETYVVPASAIESRYANMVPFGLAQAFGASGRGETRPRTGAEDRLGVTEPEFIDA